MKSPPSDLDEFVDDLIRQVASAQASGMMESALGFSTEECGKAYDETVEALHEEYARLRGHDES